MDVVAMFARISEVNFWWIGYSIGFALLSHWLRAYRWNILLGPLGYKLSTFRTFLALMVGYFANLVVPRMGEVVRCGMLKKMDDVDVPQGFGTVVTERIFDTITILIIFSLTFIAEFQLLGAYFQEIFPVGKWLSNFQSAALYVIFAVVVSVILAVYFLLKRYGKVINQYSIVVKLKGFWRSMVEGVMSIKKINQPVAFLFATLGIWFLYFLMTYIVFFAFSTTSELGLMAGFSVLIMGGLGMSAPVQGGIGTYHILVSSVLTFYGVPQQDGVLFATVVHTSQALMVVLVGTLSLVASLVITKRKNQK
jgi:glycosyltransferase 2 family protein